MNKELLELANFAVKSAKSSGANDCKVSIRKDRSVEVSYRDKKPENIKEATSKGLVIQIYANGRFSTQSTSDLRKDSLKEFISNAVKTTKLLAEDPFRTLPDPKYYEGRADIDLKIFDPEYDNITPQFRHEIVKKVEESCLSAGGSKVISVTAGERDNFSEVVTLTSNGFEGYRKSSYINIGASMSAQDEGDRKPNGYNYITAIRSKNLPDASEVGKTAAKRTLNLLGAKKIKTEKLPVIIENRNVSNILGGLLQPLNGQNIYQKQSFLLDKKGQKIASEKLTLIDDPFIPEGLGSRLYDGDGFAAKKRTIIDAGVLKEFNIDWYYSRKLKWDPTSGSNANLVIPPGTRSVKEIMKDLGRGILVTGFIGGNSNSTTGDASVGIFGQLFENGEPVQAIAEMNIAGNHLDVWNRLVEVANDPWIYSSQVYPSLVLNDIMVSGL